MTWIFSFSSLIVSAVALLAHSIQSEYDDILLPHALLARRSCQKLYLQYDQLQYVIHSSHY